MTKYIFVTGGVVSSLGKGIAAASIGLLLKSRGLTVVNQKFDPYLNVDPGTMNPYQHGEVYVTDDGTETDLDLGHYERFTGTITNRHCNYTSGQIYDSIIKKERRGDYLGGTVQVVPHVTTEICDCIRAAVNSTDIDVVITEIGGTVGDIESLPYLEALRQFRQQQGRTNVLFIHVTLMPYLDKAGEVKTKPTQHSVGRLREIGIIPDILICRTKLHLDKDIKKKLALFCNVDEEAVIEAMDVSNIYEVPMNFVSQELDTLIIDSLGLSAGRRYLKPWRDYIDKATNSDKEIVIGLVGKYSELLDAYKSIYEALNHAGTFHNTKVKIKNISAEDIENKGAHEILNNVHGILVPGGFGSRGFEGKILAIEYARINKIPFFGICLGMHMAVIEFARNVIGLQTANTTEHDVKTCDPVIHLMETQTKVKNLGASMRLGAYNCTLQKNTIAYKAYTKNNISERHRHRYEFNNDYREIFEKTGMILSGKSPDDSLIEMIELENHPWFLACQFHPEFKSRPIEPHPLFKDFIEACLKFTF